MIVINKLRIFEGFAGIGAVSKAIERLNIPYELVGFSEIDKYAVKSFCAIHNVNDKLNYGDICKINENTLPDFDLFSFGSPCQDFSVAGRQKGAVWTCKDCGYEYNPLEVHWSKRDTCPNCGSNNINKTRSSLLVEALRIIRCKRPKYLLMENVKNIVGKQFRPSFDKIRAELEEYGYNTYWSILNAKEHEIPQNRERVFVISIRKDIDNGLYKFPEKKALKVKLKDMLEQEVDKKYYLSDKGLKYVSSEYRQSHQITQINGDIALCLTAKGNSNWTGTFIAPINTNSKGIPEFTDAAITLRARDYKGMQNWPLTAVAEVQQGMLSQIYYKIRKLTPRESWRLMGFNDSDFDKAKGSGLSDTQLYKQAGNSIVVNVLEEIFKKLLL